MVVERCIKNWRVLRNSDGFANKTVGFVATMGALHKGHASLIETAKKENDLVVVSIFVNPLQFNNPEDLQNYPQTLEKDFEYASKLGVDFILNPTVEAMYPNGFNCFVDEQIENTKLEGKLRPGHFRGVLTVVLKLLQLIKPTRAYFGEKDYQQYHIIKNMAEEFFLDTVICCCPTIRDADGLPLSSRNLRLGPAAREKASEFAQAFNQNIAKSELLDSLKSLGIQVEYVQDHHQRRFTAVNIDGIRLIDNREMASCEI